MPFSSDPGGARAVCSHEPTERTLHLTDGVWTLGWGGTTKFPYASKTPSAWLAGCTALLSLLLAGLVASLQSTGERASALAAERTKNWKLASPCIRPMLRIAPSPSLRANMSRRQKPYADEKPASWE